MVEVPNDIAVAQNSLARRAVRDPLDWDKAMVAGLAEEEGVCVRPLARRLADRVSGEASTVVLPCGSTRESRCPTCAKRARVLRMHQCAEGWHRVDELLEVDLESGHQRVVINPQQAVWLLKAVEDTDPAMVGFFACMYYAALRPGEVIYLRRENCILPETGWGKLMLGGSTQYAGAWGDNGQGREDRALKHRSSRSVRPVPACPQLVRILRHHLDTYTCGPDGRLFVTRTGTQRHPVSGGYSGPVSGSSYGNTWRKARAAALTTAEVTSPLARRPYDLRHACVSL